MKHPLIAAKIIAEPWAVTEPILQAICNAVFGDERADLQIVTPKPDDEEEEDFGNGMAVIPVHGILGKHLSDLEMMCGGCSVDLLSAQLTEADKNPDCDRILLAIHSPGGMVMGIPELAAKIRSVATRKPVVAFSDGLCCSAALWLASACSAFYVTPSSKIGSVGCYSLALDLTKQMDNEGVKVNAISSGKFKLTGAPFKAMSDDERAMLQSQVDAIGAAFRASITDTRAVEAADLEGQVFDGMEATAKGFTDGLVDDLQEAIEVAIAA